MPDPQSGKQVDKAERARQAAETKAKRKELAGLRRAIKVRIYPKPKQSEDIRRTIGAIRFIWNKVWLPVVEGAEQARWDHVRAHGFSEDMDKEERAKLWKAAWKAHPDPKSDTTLTQANTAKMAEDEALLWLADIPAKATVHRAARNFIDAVKASRGRTASGASRKIKAGKVRPKSRRDDPYSGLEFQVQGSGKQKAPLGGKPIRAVIDTDTRTIKIPSFGDMPYRDKGKLLNRYLRDGGEISEMTVKRDGAHYYACLAVRGLPSPDAHLAPGSIVGIDMGITAPLATSDGEIIAEHQGHDIKAHLVRLSHLKRRAQRQCSRKFYAAAKAADALTETGAIKKGVPIPKSNRLRRAEARAHKIDRHIANFRADWQRNRALEIARHSETIVVEDLKVQNMSKSAAGSSENPGRNVRAKAGLNREILARGWYSMRQKLMHKAEEYGGQVVEVDPAYTSQTCPACGHVAKENRPTQARFQCVSCGHKGHADVVGAINILQRGMTAGAHPAAERGGFATGAETQVTAAERAVETSNKPLREPEVSRHGPEGSRSAKLRSTNSDLGSDGDMERPTAAPPRHGSDGGSRDGPD